MNRKIGSQNDLSDQKFTTRSEGDSVNTGAKETLKSIKIYIPAEGYDSKMSLEQNLAEGRVKLFSEMPASDFDMNGDPIQECLNFPNIQKQHSNNYQSSDLDQQNVSNVASQRNSDFDKLTDSYSQKTEIQHSVLNSTVQQSVTPRESEKLHSCDVCYKSFSRRRDLALHYLTHSEKEKRRGAKALKKCDICGNNPLQCHCKSVVEKIYPNYTNLPSSISIPKPINSTTVFVKAESTSGKSSLIKRELYHCPECDQTFGLEMQRKQHVLVHKRERARREREQKSFSCDYCDEKFSDKSNVVSHVSTSHPECLQLV